MRKTERKTNKRKEIERELDKLWKAKVLERDGRRCKICGKTDRLQAHHIFTRSRKSTRWDLDNGITLCAGHHYWAHREPERFRRFIISLIGEDKYDELYRKSQEKFSLSIERLTKILEDLKKRR